MTKKRIRITSLELIEKHLEIDRIYYAPANSTAVHSVGGYTPQYLEILKSQEQSQDAQDKTNDR